MFISPDYAAQAIKVINHLFPDLIIKRCRSADSVFFRAVPEVPKKENPCDSGQEIKTRVLR